MNVTKYPLETADLVTFTVEILNGKLHFLCSVIPMFSPILFTITINGNMHGCVELWVICGGEESKGPSPNFNSNIKKISVNS